MDEISLSVPRYRGDVGVIAPVEGGTVRVELVDGAVQLIGDPAGLRDLARWCLSLSDPLVADGRHIHLDPGYVPLSSESVPLVIARDEGIDATPVPSPRLSCQT
ncbi:Imm32 family immunity protein [Kribbella sp. NPDC055110]